MHITIDQSNARGLIDDMYSCMDACLDNVRQKSCFQIMCAGLNEELAGIEDALREFLDSVSEALPVQDEEPKDINWLEESERCLKYKDRFVDHRLYEDTLMYANLDDIFTRFTKKQMEDETENAPVPTNMHSLPYEHPKFLVSKLKRMSDLMEIIFEALNPIDSSIYVQYCKDEIQQFELHLWNRKLKDFRMELCAVSRIHLTEFYNQKISEYLNKLTQLAPEALNKEKAEVYYEGLGRYLWKIGHETEPKISIDEVLTMVRSAKYYSDLAEKEFTFHDREKSEEELKQPDVLAEVQKQTVIQNHFLGLVNFTCSCKDYFAAHYDRSWIDGFWRAMIYSPIDEYICTRLNADSKKYKVQCQIIGELKQKGVFCGSDMKLAEAVHKGREKFLPDIKTIYDYIRHPFTKEKNLKGARLEENTAISNWIQSYVPNEGCEIKDEG